MTGSHVNFWVSLDFFLLSSQVSLFSSFKLKIIPWRYPLAGKRQTITWSKPVLSRVAALYSALGCPKFCFKYQESICHGRRTKLGRGPTRSYIIFFQVITHKWNAQMLPSHDDDDDDDVTNKKCYLSSSFFEWKRTYFLDVIIYFSDDSTPHALSNLTLYS